MKPKKILWRYTVKRCPDFFIEKVLPAIKEKWPREDLDGTIFIQQDNAITYIDIDDYLIPQVVERCGINICLMCQPPNSPDLHILDLAFFQRIQALQYKEAPKTTLELVNVVVQSFETFPSTITNRIFLSLQLCMIR